MNEKSFQDIEHVARVRMIEDWLKRIRAPADISIDLADVLYAARRADQIIAELLTIDIDESSGSERAVDLLAELHTWLFGEMKHHLMELEGLWADLEGAVNRG